MAGTRAWFVVILDAMLPPKRCALPGFGLRAIEHFNDKLHRLIGGDAAGSRGSMAGVELTRGWSQKCSGGNSAGDLEQVLMRMRNIHEYFQPFLPENPHEYCAKAFESDRNSHLQHGPCAPSACLYRECVTSSSTISACPAPG
jgi:hypothetical protein